MSTDGTNRSLALTGRPAATWTKPKPRLLLADDDRGIRESLSKLLRGVGYDVTLATNGGHVLETVYHHSFHVLLLDLNMPEMDGWETLARVTQLRPHLPIVVITAQPNQRDWLARGGARALMEKPLDLPLLLQTLQDLLTDPAPAVAASPPPAGPRFRHLPPRRFPVDFIRRVRGLGIND